MVFEVVQFKPVTLSWTFLGMPTIFRSMRAINHCFLDIKFVYWVNHVFLPSLHLDIVVDFLVTKARFCLIVNGMHAMLSTNILWRMPIIQSDARGMILTLHWSWWLFVLEEFNYKKLLFGKVSEPWGRALSLVGWY